MNKETLEEENFSPIEKELIKEAKKVWRESSPNPIEMALFGAKWQAEQEKNKYSEEEVGELVYNIIGQYANQVNIMIDGDIIDRLFEQFKKK